MLLSVTAEDTVNEYFWQEKDKREVCKGEVGPQKGRIGQKSRWYMW